MSVNFIKLNDLVIKPDRQRQEFDQSKHQDLIESIKANGLIHAINVTKGEFGYELITGECRLRAITDIYEFGGTIRYAGSDVDLNKVPCVDLGSLTTLEAELIELDENSCRTDLTWQETVSATARIMDLRSKQAKITGKAPPSRVDVAAELRLPATTAGSEVVRQNLILARNLDNPVIANAKTSSEAFKLLKRDSITKQNIALAKTIGSTLSGVDHKLLNQDCFVYMDTQPDSIFDVICTDPPYGMGADSFGDSNGGGGVCGGHFYKDDEDLVESLIQQLPAELYRLAKADAHLYLFADFSFILRWQDALAEAGWNVFRTPLIFYKPSGFRAPWPEHGPQRKYGCIIYARKGNKKCTKLYGDVLEHGPDSNLGHQAQKPVGLYTDLLKRSVTPGDLVFDPFCGTGPIFKAAHDLACKAVGCELDESAYGIAAKRIQELGVVG